MATLSEREKAALNCRIALFLFALILAGCGIEPLQVCAEEKLEDVTIDAIARWQAAGDLGDELTYGCGGHNVTVMWKSLEDDWGRIFFNERWPDDYRMYVDPEQPKSALFDTVTHELGHALRCEHSHAPPKQGSLMQESREWEPMYLDNNSVDYVCAGPHPCRIKTPEVH